MGDIIKFRMPDLPKSTGTNSSSSDNLDKFCVTAEEIQQAREQLTMLLNLKNRRDGIMDDVDLSHNPNAEIDFAFSKKIDFYPSRKDYEEGNSMEYKYDDGKSFIFTNKKTGELFRVCFPSNADGSIDFRITSIRKQIMKIEHPKELHTHPKLKIV